MISDETTVSDYVGLPNYLGLLSTLLITVHH